MMQIKLPDLRCKYVMLKRHGFERILLGFVIAACKCFVYEEKSAGT